MRSATSRSARPRDHIGSDGDPRTFVQQLIDDFPTDGAPVRHSGIARLGRRETTRGASSSCESTASRSRSALFFASLPMSYSAARGANVLTRTAELTTGHTTRRLAETGQMLLDLMAVDDGIAPLQPGTKGPAATRGVCVCSTRGAAYGPQRRGLEWDQAGLGLPINQEDLLGTLVVFTVVVVDALEKLGVDFGNAKTRGAMHTSTTGSRSDTSWESTIGSCVAESSVRPKLRSPSTSSAWCRPRSSAGRPSPVSAARP